jgi:hypothetical protein
MRFGTIRLGAAVVAAAPALRRNAAAPPTRRLFSLKFCLTARFRWQGLTGTSLTAQSYLGFSELRGCSDFMFVPGTHDCHVFVMRVGPPLAAARAMCCCIMLQHEAACVHDQGRRSERRGARLRGDKAVWLTRGDARRGGARACADGGDARQRYHKLRVRHRLGGQGSHGRNRHRARPQVRGRLLARSPSRVPPAPSRPRPLLLWLPGASRETGAEPCHEAPRSSVLCACLPTTRSHPAHNPLTSMVCVSGQTASNTSTAARFPPPPDNASCRDTALHRARPSGVRHPCQRSHSVIRWQGNPEWPRVAPRAAFDVCASGTRHLAEACLPSTSPRKPLRQGLVGETRARN